MNALVVTASLLAVGTALNGFAASPTQLAVDAKMLREGGDCLDDEVLAWRRLRAERQIVVHEDDSVPIVARDAGGRIYAVTGSGKLLLSDDCGLSFSKPVQIAIGGASLSGVQAMGVLNSGKLLIAYGTMGELFLAGSDDGGKTWQTVSELKTAGYDGIEAGDGIHILQRADETVLLPVIRWKGEAKQNVEGIVYGSQDNGKTWDQVGNLGRRCSGTNLLQLKTGDLLAAISYRGAMQEGEPEPEVERKELFNNIVVARSRDGGKTWTDYQCVTRYKEAPADLIELSDGTVVLTYGQQNFPYGARSMVSKDGGRTWSPSVYVLGFSTLWKQWQVGIQDLTEPGWFVSSLALPDGMILTFYTRGSFVLTEEAFRSPWYMKNGELGEKGKCILAARWTPDGMQKPPLSFPGVIAKPNADGYLDNGRCLINPEHMNEGGDYFYKDEILVYERVPAEHHTVGQGTGPIVCLDPKGRQVVAAEQGHVYRSKDGGRGWENISAVPGGGIIQSFGILRDGTMLAGSFLRSEWTVSVFRSEDDGKTWKGPIPVDKGAFDRMGAGNCMRIIQTVDGTALMTCGNLIGHLPGGNPGDGVYRSRDGGKTWGNFSYIGHPCCETNILELKSGRLLAVTRVQGGRMPDDFIVWDKDDNYRYNVYIKNVSIAASDDEGYTWSSPRTVTRYFECPADLVQMDDGTLVLSYQQKNAPPGARAMISRDEGKTWDPRLYMLGWSPRSGGHTSSILLNDGRLLTMIGVQTGDGQNILKAIIWKPL